MHKNEINDIINSDLNDYRKTIMQDAYQSAFQLGQKGRLKDIETWLNHEPDFPETYVRSHAFKALINGALFALRDQDRTESLVLVVSELTSRPQDRRYLFKSDFVTITENELNLLYNAVPEQQRQDRLNTLLEFASKNSAPDFVKTLINAGADPSVKELAKISRHIPKAPKF